MARAAHQRLGLPRVDLLPAHCSPHKQELQPTSPAHRRALADLLAQEEPWLRVDDRELRRRGISYTIDTVEEILASESSPKPRLYLVIGSDNLFELHRWHRAEELVRRVQIVTIPRLEGDVDRARTELPRVFPGPVADLLVSQILDVAPVDVSSTEVRQRVARGRSIDDLVPESIARYIDAHALYKRQRPSD